MNRFISKKALFSLFLCLFLWLQTEAANHGNKTGSQSAICSDPQQPASLRCAPAPSSQFDEQGRLWIAWSYGGHVYVSSSDDQGITLNQSVVVNRIPERISAHGENRPKIVIDASGKIYISWTTPLEKRYTGNVRFSVSEDMGQHFSDPVIVNDNLDITGHRFESLSVNDQGIIYMAWLDKRDRFKARKKGQKYHGAALYYSYSKDGGKSFEPNQNIMPHSCECCRVIMDIDDDQLPVVMWRNIYGSNTRDHSLVKFSQNDSPGAVIRVSYDNWKVDACPHHGPALSISKSDINSSSIYHLAWFNNAPDSHGIFYSKMRDPNTIESKTSDSLPVKPIAIGHYKKGASHPDILSLRKKVWLVWKEFDGEQETIWLQFSDNNGDSWNQAVIVAQTKNGSDYPFLINHKEKLYLQWQTNDNGFKLYPLN